MTIHHLKIFYSLSEALTGFSKTDLLSTGVGEEYYVELTDIAGYQNVEDLFIAVENTLTPHATPNVDDVTALLKDLWEHPRFGPMIRNIITMWYVGNWKPLPDLWLKEYCGEDPKLVLANRSHVVSAQAYKEGLVWRVLGAHPPGAKPTGYGSWALLPQYDS